MPTTRSLDERIQAIEERLEIYHLIASHPQEWRVEAYPLSQVLTPAHQAAIAGGLAHFSGLPHVAISGDSAVVTSYLQIIVPQMQGSPVEVPNHGSSKGFRIHRMNANRWDLVRTPQGWKIKHRTLRQLDGSEPARAILRQAIAR